MIPLHQDMVLTGEQKQRVHDWIRTSGFEVPGAGPGDFEVVDKARYVGFLFTHEDLESFVVGLQCTKEGMEDVRTTIRMSHGQLMGDPQAPVPGLQPPSTAADSMRMNRWRSQGHSNASLSGLPGIDLDLTLLEDCLEDVLAFAATYGSDTSTDGWYELSVQWGVLLSGRLPRLRYYAGQDRLTGTQTQRLRALRRRTTEHHEAIRGLDLPMPR